MKKLILIAVLIISFSLFSETDSRYDAGLNMPFNQKAGEVNPQTGNVTINVTDLSLPGRTGKNFIFGRMWNLNSSNVFNMDVNPNTGNNRISSNTPDANYRLGVGWSSTIPYMHHDSNGGNEVTHLFFGGSAYQIDLGNVESNNLNNSNILGYDLLDKRVYAGALGGELSYSDYIPSLIGHSEYVLILKDNSKYYFLDNGNLMMEQDPSGLNKIWYFYDDEDRLEKVVDTVGREIFFNYSAAGNLSEISWDVTSWEKDEDGNRSKVTSTRRIKYGYKTALNFPEVHNIKDDVENYREPYYLTSATNQIGETTTYDYQEGVTTFSFTDRYSHDNVCLMLTSVKQNVDGDNYSAGKFYEYEVPAKGMYIKFFYTGFMEYFKVSRTYNHDLYKNIKADTFYTYFENGENGNFNQYSTLIQQGNVSTTYYYSLKDAPNLYQVLGKIETETKDGFNELKRFAYDNNKAKVLDEVYRFGEIKYFEKFIYDKKGNLKSFTDKQGLITNKEYDEKYSIPIKEQKIVSYLSEEKKYKREWVLTDSGQIEKSVLFVEDGDRLRPITEQSVTYDKYGNVVTVTDANGNVQTIEYDDETKSFPIYSWGKVTIDSYETGSLKENWINRPNKKENVTVGSKKVFNSDGSIYMEFDPEGNGVENFYDELGREIETISPSDSDNTTWFKISDEDITKASGFLNYLNNRNNNPGTKTIINDKEAFIETIKDIDKENGKSIKTAIQFDGLGNPLEEYTFDENGNIWGITTKIYDDMGRMLSLTDPDAGDDYSIVNVKGFDIKRFDKTWIIKYDDLGRQVKVLYPDNNDGRNSIKLITYNDNNNSVQTIDPEDRRSVVTSDWAGNILEVINYGYSYTPEEDARIYRYSYDTLNRKRTFVDAKGEETYYEYDERDQIIIQTYGDSGSDVMRYNDLSLIIEKTDRKGNIVKSTYDEAGRPVEISRFYPDETLDETTYISYNLRGLNWRVEGKELTEFSEFDSKGALITHSRYLKSDMLRNQTSSALPLQDESYTFNYEYTDSGLIKSMKYPDGGIHNFNYRDGTGYLESINEGKESATTFVDDIIYNKCGVVTSMNWRNGVNQSWEFDNRKRIKRLTVSRPDKIIQDLNYTLNSVGDIKFINSNEYKYNGFGEIAGSKTLIPGKINRSEFVRASFGSSLDDDGFIMDKTFRSEADLNKDGIINGIDHHMAFLNDRTGTFDEELFSYDKSGNRLTLNQNGDEYTYEYGIRNQLNTIYKNEVKLIDYEYDKNGNTIKKTVYSNKGNDITTFKYDTINRLVETENLNGNCKYYYDNAGNRFFKSLDNSKTIYLRQGAIAAAMDIELKDNGDSTVNRYVLSGDLVAGRVSNGEYSYYHLDHLNSTKIVTNKDGEAEVLYEYRAFGEQLRRLNENKEEIDDFAKYTYGTKELDDNTNLYYFNARYYDATTGRFINVDPIQDGTNWYIYCSNNPLNMIDPTGLKSLAEGPSAKNIGDDIITAVTSVAFDKIPGGSYSSILFDIYKDAPKAAGTIVGQFGVMQESKYNGKKFDMNFDPLNETKLTPDERKWNNQVIDFKISEAKFMESYGAVLMGVISEKKFEQSLESYDMARDKMSNFLHDKDKNPFYEEGKTYNSFDLETKGMEGDKVDK